jgi:hypothetical protein
MVKVLTIRDPKTGALIAEEQIQPNEDKDSALARIYRKAFGSDAPEFMVITKAIWLDDRDWAAELVRDWGGFELALLGPKGDSDLAKTRLVLARVSEAQPVSRMEFPTDKRQLDATKHGRRHNAVVPFSPESPPAVGDRVTFREAASDPFGFPVLVPNGDAVSVDLTEVRNQGHKWVGQDLYYIAWNPLQAKKKLKIDATDGSR